MELVILSTIAAVAILIAELIGLAGREHDTGATTPAAPRLTSIASLSSDSRAANQDRDAAASDLDRAA